MTQQYVPVVSKDNQPLMPCTPAKARKLIKQDKAIAFFKLGIFSIKLKFDCENQTQFIVLAIDPGSKKEGYTVKSASATYSNIQCDAVDWVKDNVEGRREQRRGRRYRKTPCRAPRWANRGNSKRSNRLPPSTKARCDLKLSIANKLSKLYPIKGISIEDITAIAKKGKSQKRWNESFSPLEVGKKYLYAELNKIAPVKTTSGLRTSQLRTEYQLAKTKDKLSDDFSAHCVDSWVMAADVVGAKSNIPDNKSILYLSPYLFNRRSLHKLQPSKGSIRVRTGGTRSLGFKKGSIVRHPKHGKCIVGGYIENKLSLVRLSGKHPTKEKGDNRVSRSVNPNDCEFLTFNRFYIRD